MHFPPLKTSQIPSQISPTASWKQIINQMIEDHKYMNNDDRSAFITEAVKRYCAEIDGERSMDVLCDRMYKIISAEADSHSSRMAHLLFKIAVEIGILNHMIGASFVNLNDAEMRFIRNNVTNTVRKSHGFVSFEKAVEDERAHYNGA